jgi:hypothetical protein
MRYPSGKTAQTSWTLLITEIESAPRTRDRVIGRLPLPYNRSGSDEISR